MLLIEVASCNESADFDLVARAYHFAHQAHAGQIRKSGEPFLQHIVEVARILAQLRLDTTTVAAGLLHDVVEDTEVTQDQIESRFGSKISALIDGVTKIERFQLESREARQAETFRKMLLSMVEDIRVILVKFADRLHNMRTLDALDDHQRQRISHEPSRSMRPCPPAGPGPDPLGAGGPQPQASRARLLPRDPGRRWPCGARSGSA